MTNHTGKIAGTIIVAALVGLVASGCSSTGDATNQQQKDVYAAAVALTNADNVAIRYVTLPLCGPARPKPACSEAAVSARIKAAAQQAHDAVKAAGAGTGTLAAANSAIATLVAITPKPAG